MDIDNEEQHEQTVHDQTSFEVEADKILEPISACGPANDSWSYHSIKAMVGKEPTHVIFREPVMLGIDEAGRGPVLGPMVYAIAVAPISRKKEVKALGVDDSKKLKESDRYRLFVEMNRDHNDWIGWSVRSISPREISAGMLRVAKFNLNEQAYSTTIGLIKGVMELGVDVKEIFVDTVGKEKPYQAVLERQFPGISITVASKADSKYPIVTRDSAIRNWKFTESETGGCAFSRDFGSGYPSDPYTVKWLKNAERIFGYPNIIRFSWATCQKKVEKGCIPVKWYSDSEDKKNAAITQFFKSTAKVAPSKTASTLSRSSTNSNPGGDDDENFSENEENDEDNEEEILHEESENTMEEEGNNKRKRGASGLKKNGSTARVKRTKKGADAEDDSEGESGQQSDMKQYRMNVLTLSSTREKTLAVDSDRDEQVFRGLSLRHISRF
ncbi:Ribonuclease H2 subunit A [Blyttiomyces sp. JEL0837]|nr:Ribonuclease H2 subunit A [Blyttiomyces sp. JEL0837]